MAHLTARVAPSWGGQATSGAEALWGRETMAGLAHGSVANGTRLEAELGYGLPVGSRFVATPTGVVARIVTGPHDANRQDPHRPMRYDTGRPRAVIRLRISQPMTASLPCPAGLRARRPSPMMDLYRKNVFSTRP